MRNVITISTGLFLATTAAMAQLPNMYLTMVENGNGQLEVRARPDDDFGGLFAALTFTIRWDSAAGLALDTAVRHPAAVDYMPVTSQAPVYFSNGYAYRVYNGFAFSPIVASGPAFLADHEYPLCTIDILVPGTAFELIYDAWRQKERITRTGFTLEEQVMTLQTALRMMGLVRNFARLVLFCAHGSTTENNPYESALDCGGCGGNEGKPNARVLAAMANRQPVRERLAKRGIVIPPDTHFLAGQVDTTTDEVQLFDLETRPRRTEKPSPASTTICEKRQTSPARNAAPGFPMSATCSPLTGHRPTWPGGARTGARCGRNGACPAPQLSSSAAGS